MLYNSRQHHVIISMHSLEFKSFFSTLVTEVFRHHATNLQPRLRANAVCVCNGTIVQIARGVDDETENDG